MLDVYVLDQPRTLEPSEYDLLLRLISPEKRRRVERFGRFSDASNTLLADLLAKAALSDLTGLPPQRFRLSATPSGKPFCADTSTHLSLSHSDDCVVCALSDVSVGVDVQRVRPVSLSIARRFFAPDESAFVERGADGNAVDRFFTVWTKKESFVKRDGRGLALGLGSFSVLGGAPGVDFHEVRIRPSLVCHVCAAHPPPPRRRDADLDDLLSRVRDRTA